MSNLIFIPLPPFLITCVLVHLFGVAVKRLAMLLLRDRKKLLWSRQPGYLGKTPVVRPYLLAGLALSDYQKFKISGFCPMLR